MRPIPRCFAALSVCGLALLANIAGAEACDAPFSFLEEQPPVLRTYGDLRNGRPVVIAAVGGASTQGSAAGDDLRLAWPERMAAALSRRFPAAAVRAVNLGVARQSAQDMLRRIDGEVLKMKPSLVVWETGTADAVRGVSPEDFRETLQAGIDRLKAQKIDVMRRTLALYDLTEYLNTLNELADVNGIPIFHRHEAMRAWSDAGVFDFDVADPAKRRVVAAGLYDCIGEGVAALIERGGKKPAVPANTAPGKHP